MNAAKDIFLDAIDLPGSARSSLLDRACGDNPSLRAEVEALLRAHETAGEFLAEPTTSPSQRSGDASHLAPGREIGPYRIGQEIGEGGFGVVYLAEQTEPVRRRVALKVIKPSNVLIAIVDGKPEPRVIDFGIAKAVAGTLPGHTTLTHAAQIVGTPQYMAPEQAALDNTDVDTRADIFAEVAGPEHPNALVLRSNRAAQRVSQERFADALADIEPVLARAPEVFGPTRSVTIGAVRTRARALTGLGRCDEAEKALLDAHALVLAELGSDDSQAVRLAEAIAELYDAWDRPGDAAEWRPAP